MSDNNDNNESTTTKRKLEENENEKDSKKQSTEEVKSEKKTGKGYEYLDHTADIQFHAWAPTIEQTYEQTLLAMFNYMTELSYVEIVEEREMEAEGHDLESLLFGFLDEWLFIFSTEFFVCKEIEILEFDTENFKIKAKGKGELFDKKKHPQGTEIKAITYSNMQVRKGEEQSEIYVIVDI